MFSTNTALPAPSAPQRSPLTNRGAVRVFVFVAGLCGDVAGGGGTGRFGRATYCAHALFDPSDSAIATRIVITVAVFERMFSPLLLTAGKCSAHCRQYERSPSHYREPR
jgi:hypothetical protein